MIKSGIFNLSNKTSLAFILILTAVFVLDTTIVSFSSYSGVEFPVWLNITIFMIFYIIFVSSSTILLGSVSNVIPKYRNNSSPFRLAYFQGVIVATQLLSAAFILIIIIQMLFLNRYSILLLIAQTYLGHFVALVFLSLLVFLFGKWLTLKRSYVVLLYALAFSISCVNLVISFLYFESYLSNSALPDAIPYPINDIVTNFPGLPLPQSLSQAFDALSLSSFLCMWIATVLLLSQYRYKMGRIKYFSLLSIPLVYYIFPFQNYFGDAFFSMLQSDPVSFSIIYILTFSATRQVGALLFSLVFWTTSMQVPDHRIRKSLLLSSIGISIFFGSLVISPLQFHVYPPYGLVTEAFIPLGAYFLFVGIFTSAVHISRDSQLRKEIYDKASSQLKLLKNIGVSQMEKELEERYKIMQEKISKFPDIKNDFLSEDYSEENVKEILHDVLTELYYSRSNIKPEKL